jgi:hypothetical protein
MSQQGDASRVDRRTSGGSKLGRAIQGAALLLIFVSCAYYPAVFVYRFELFGLPVRDNDHGWLGPTPRGTTCARDIGKVNYWECKDISIFEKHYLGCRIWLWANGITE